MLDNFTESWQADRHDRGGNTQKSRILDIKDYLANFKEVFANGLKDGKNG